MTKTIIAKRIIGLIALGLAFLNVELQAKTYGMDSPRPCIAEKACEVENPHWNSAITKVSVTYRDEMKNTHQWVKMINSAEGIKDCDKAAAYFPHRFEKCAETKSE